MAASYPVSPKSFSTKTDGAGQTIFAAHVNDLQDEVVAVETALISGGVAHGLKPSVAGAQDLGTASLPWGTLHARALQLDAVSTLTIASGIVTVTRSSHAVDTEGAAAADDLDTLTATGLTDGFVLILRAANVAHVVTLKDGTGNLLLNGDCALSSTDATITLYYDGTNWREMARSGAASFPMRRLRSASGTSSAAGATNVDTIAITGLTALDRLWVKIDALSVANSTSTIGLYNSTDSVALNTSVASLASGATLMLTCDVNQSQASATSIDTKLEGKDTVPTVYNSIVVATFTQLWTGSWTLALRHGGVGGGGTLQWKWSVYLLAGQ